MHGIWLDLAIRLRKFDASTVGGAIFAVLANPGRHYRIVRAISGFRGGVLHRHQPHLHLKYLNPRHLSHALDTSQRAEALLYNLRFIQATFTEAALDRMVDGGIVAWRFDGDHHLRLGFEHLYTTEGELTLGLRDGSNELYALSFTFVDGRLFDQRPMPVIFITRLQGGRGVREFIDDATHLMGQTHPRLVLMAGLQGLAQAVGIDTAIGISASDQVCRDEFSTAESVSYDRFFETIGASLCLARVDSPNAAPARYYKIDLPLPEKDIALIKVSHRSRSKAKRLFRRRVADEVFRTIEPFVT